jgi:hypothetical protein
VPPEPATVTAASHGLKAGDAIDVPLPLSFWARVFYFLGKSGWSWPPRVVRTTYYVTKVSDEGTFTVDTGRMSDGQ